LKYLNEAGKLYSPEFGKNFGAYLDEIHTDYFRSMRDYNKVLEYVDKTLQYYRESNLLDLSHKMSLAKNSIFTEFKGALSEQFICQ
jgi:hypothetical protein